MARRLSQEEWDRRIALVGMEWLEPVEKSDVKAWARCLEEGHEYEKLPDKASQGRRCKYCAPNAPVSPAVWDERAETVGIKWLRPVKNNRDKHPAKCLTCTHKWPAVPGNVQQGQGCPECARKRKGKYQSLSQEEWQDRARAANLVWLELVETGLTKTPAMCLNDWCRYEWEPFPVNVLTKRSGCPVCARYGFDPMGKAVIYLVAKADGTAKIGITGAKAREKRVARHRKNGYKLIQTWKVAIGADARAVEKALVFAWRKAGYKAAAPKGEDGWTESVSATNISLEEIEKQVSNQLRRIEGL